MANIDDEREALMALFARTPGDEPGLLDEGSASHESWERYMADAILASDVWCNRHRGSIPDDPRALGYALDDLDDGADFQDAINPDSIRLVVKTMRAALEAAEAAR